MAEPGNEFVLNVEGMTCANCAAGISRYLEKHGAQKPDVDFASGKVRFILDRPNELSNFIKGINALGYKVNMQDQQKKGISPLELKFYLSLVFSIPLFLHMFFEHGILHNPFVQLALTIPVFLIGLFHFGRSALGSIKSGVPNMDVLIMIGTGSAFLYSLISMANDPHSGDLYFETTTTIISLVLLGNVIEFRSVKKTSEALTKLQELQPDKANKVINGKTIEIGIHDLKPGDIVQVNTGDHIPADGKIISGEGTLNESMITGESLPVEKTENEFVTGGTLLNSGSIKVEVSRVGNESSLARIIDLVSRARQNKPSIQKTGDNVAAVFVPVVIGISILTFIISFFLLDLYLRESLMRSIAVLVISCPCAMGLATPTAVMSGIGRAAKNGILIKGGDTLEKLAIVDQVVFDKTGTITTGRFKIKRIEVFEGSDKNHLENILYSLEGNSSHPIALSITRELDQTATKIPFISFRELKGVGLEGKDEQGNTWYAGTPRGAGLTAPEFNIIILKNGKKAGGVEIFDELKQDTRNYIGEVHSLNISSYLLSGDKEDHCRRVAGLAGIKSYFSEKLPDQKLEIISELEKKGRTAMVGDGINDAPALSKAFVGISISGSTQVAVESAQVILLNPNNLSQVPFSFKIARHTLLTIKQNLFWAFIYNIVAIPLAASGLLTPMVAALSMAFSDVVVIGNSIRLKTKNLD